MRTYEMTDDLTEFDRYQAYFGTSGLLNEYRNKTELAMRKLGEPDFEIYRPERIDAYFPYSTRTESQKADYNIALFAIAQNEHNYQYVPESLRTPEFVNMAFKLNPRVVKFLPKEFHTFEHLKMVAKYKPELLIDMGIDSSQHVALTAVTLNPSIYLELHDDWKSNNQIMYAAINKGEDSNIRDIHYEQNRAYIQDVLKFSITKEVAPTKEEKEIKRYKGPALTMDTGRKKDKK